MTSPGLKFAKTMVRLLWLLVILSCSLAQASLPRDGLLTATRSGSLTVAGSFGGQLSSLYANTNRAELYSDATFATAQGLSLANGYNQFVTAGTNAAGALVLSTVTTNWLPVTVSFSYDLNGNLVSDGQKSYEYDRANQLTSVTLPGEWRTEYAYDGRGRRRISREYTWRGSWALANEVRYVYDRMLVLQERRADNTVLATYTRGLDLSGSMQGAGGIGGLLARTDSAGSTYYHSDGGGNITSLTDSSGAVVARYLYDPFGRLLGRWGAMAEVNRYQFSSKETDRLTGLSYYGYRFYDPSLQRWLNQDPLGEAGGINLYGFVAGNPLWNVDRSGLDMFLWSGGGAAGHNWTGNGQNSLLKAPIPEPEPKYAAPPVIYPPGTTFLNNNDSSVVRSDFLNGMGGSQFIGTGLEDEVAEAQAELVTAFLPLPLLKCPQAAKSELGILGKGSTADLAKGTTLPRNLREQLAIEQAAASPAAGTKLPINMTDPRWPGAQGWQKMDTWIKPGGDPINVHYLYNPVTKQIDDFKIVLPGPR